LAAARRTLGIFLTQYDDSVPSNNIQAKKAALGQPEA